MSSNNHNTLSATHLKNSLGSFWTNFFSDQSLLNGWCQGLSLQSRQLDRNTEEIVKLSGIQTTPEEHIELWRPIHLVYDKETGSFYPLRFESNGAKFGEQGSLPFHNKVFSFGDNTDHLGLEMSEDIKPNGIMFLTDSIGTPSFVWTEGVDYEVRNGVIVFTDNVIQTGLLEGLKEEETYQYQDVYTLWGYNCSYDLQYLASQWGYLLRFERESSTEYNRALWELWKARRFGLTVDTFSELISIYLKCPRSKEDETVEEVLELVSGETQVITDKNVYELQSCDPVRFSIGDSMRKGEFLGSRVDIVEPGKTCFTRETIKRLDEYKDNKLLGNPDYIETKYIRFTAEEAPSTINKNHDLDYTPSYAKIYLPSGDFDVTVNAVHRYSQYDLTIEIDVTMLPVPGTQVGTLQIFSVSGVPFFSEPYTASINPIKGVFTFFTDPEELLIEKKDAFDDLVDKVERVVLISIFEDSETYTIKSALEGLRFSDKHRISVTSYPSVSVYSDLPTEGASFSTVTQEHLLDYDMVILNTGSGIISKLKNGETQGGPSIADNEFIQTIVANIDLEISEKRKELATIDQDLVWLLNYVHKGDKPFDYEWLYQLCGTRGIPERDSIEGNTFYKYGSFSRLDQEKIEYHETNNQKTKQVFSIPEKLWPSSTGLGVVTRETTVPVYSKRIDISGTTPRLETSLTPGVEYVYKVSNLSKR